MLRLISQFACPVVLLACVGCGSGGPDTNYVQGTVTLDGEPLEGATVNFPPAGEDDGRPAVGRTDEKGVYKMTDMGGGEHGAGVTAGKYNVSVVKQTVEQHDYPQVGDPDYGKISAEPEDTKVTSEIPEKYGNTETSGLTTTIESGSNENVDFDLSSDG